ncbi:MAG: bifunctional diguanylate cyclase/phosphodiesterase [Frankiales bacterium]|nr:bifunctional diguanylate cyclase/phosphodiesterase [Frankiales bacterium]
MLRLRIRDLDGRIVYADDGTTSGVDDNSTKAARGAVVTEITRLDADAFAERKVARPGPRVVEVYEPLVSAGHRVGVLELYLPYAPIAADIAQGQRMLAIVLGCGLLALWLCLIGISASTSRRLRRQVAINAFLAEHDPLTNMPNRSQFAHRAAAAIADATADRPTAVAVIDLDRFKIVNDTLGHRNGDQLLVTLAERLGSRLRDGDTVARLGGDEFGVVLPFVHGPGEAVEVLTRLRQVVAEPLDIDGLPLAVEASIGFALAPDDGTDVDTLLQRADVAMYVAKRDHLGTVHYRADHDQYDAGALRLVAELGAAIECNELLLHYQPKADLHSESVTALEALVRWNHPERGLLYPDAFLPAAEQTELVEPLTRWVMRQAFRDLHELDPQGTLAMAVNVSARSVTRPEFVEDVLRVLEETGTAPERVILEITETALVADPARAAQTLSLLHDAGVRISIDDFGAGQTSLGYLAALPITELKIDKTFVLSMVDDERNAAIVRSVIELGHSLGFTVTAEGVETTQILDRLSDACCDTVQGYLLARPTTAVRLPAAISDVARMLRHGARPLPD